MGLEHLRVIGKDFFLQEFVSQYLYVTNLKAMCFNKLWTINVILKQVFDFLNLPCVFSLDSSPLRTPHEPQIP